jgi:tetratricopeptide (TPR) repeat protein
MRRLSRLLLTCGLFAAAPAAAQQWPPQKLVNLKVLPANIALRPLVDTMAGFTRALGVRCTFCHVGTEGADLGTYDFVSDSLSTKRTAREMMRMVLAINQDYVSKVAEPSTSPTVVTCATCHRGIMKPRPLQQVIIGAYDAGGLDSAESAYRALRERYYGRAAYDFGEVPLADVAAAVQARDKLADAVALYKLNIEMSPKSGFALRQAAAAELAAGDTTAAVKHFENALQLNANDAQARDALDRIKKKKGGR